MGFGIRVYNLVAPEAPPATLGPGQVGESRANPRAQATGVSQTSPNAFGGDQIMRKTILCWKLGVIWGGSARPEWGEAPAQNADKHKLDTHHCGASWGEKVVLCLDSGHS